MTLLEAILAEIPAYESYPSMEAMDADTLCLSQTHPARAHVRTLCKSPAGRDMLCLTLSGGTKNALVVGSLSPNEPAGALAAQFLGRYFCEHPDALDTLGTTLHLIKSADPDGTALNESWFNGPLDLFHYVRSCYCPAMDAPIPQVIQDLIEETAPNMVCMPCQPPLTLPGDWHAAARAFLSVQILAVRPLLSDRDPFTAALDARLAAPPVEKGSIAPLLDLGLLLNAVDHAIIRAIGRDAAFLLETLARTDRFLRETCESIEAAGGGMFPSIREQVAARVAEIFHALMA